MQRLSEIPVGGWCTVQRLEGDPALRRRLATMGFLPGVRVKVARCAPLGDPRAYELLGYCISLRREEAELVRVTPLTVYTLDRAPAGGLRVLEISGGRGAVANLARLGIVAGARLTKRNDHRTGRVVIETAGGRFPLGRGIAQRVKVLIETDERKTSD